MVGFLPLPAVTDIMRISKETAVGFHVVVPLKTLQKYSKCTNLLTVISNFHH